MKRKLFIIMGLLAIILGIIIFVRLLSGEDNWVCEDGKWVKHGFPREEIPSKICQ